MFSRFCLVPPPPPLSRPRDIQDWHLPAAELVARTGCALQDAATELGVQITSAECKTLLRRPHFQRILWEARHRFYSDLANDPKFSQDVVVGRLLANAQKLEEQGEYDKASEVLLKLAKVKGWVGPENQVSVFGDLSQRDLDAIRESVQPKPKVM